MPRWTTGVWAVLAIAPGLIGGSSTWKERGWFIFRDAALEKSDSAFIRGVRAFVFHDWERAERELRAAASATRSSQATAARAYLDVIFELSGRHRDAVAVLDEILRRQHATPAQVERHPGRSVESILSAYPDQCVAERRLSRIRFEKSNSGHLVIPVSVNGKSTKFMVDTGAENSSVTESGALRLGLRVHKIDRVLATKGNGVLHLTGVAVAKELAIGGFRLRNVPLILLREESELDYGTIGMNVMLAIETFRWTADGVFETGFPAGAPDPAMANLCLGRSGTLLTEVQFGTERLTGDLDTGADKSFLKPAFARQFPALLRQRGSRTSYDPEFIGRPAKLFRAVRLPDAVLMVGGCEATLRNVPVLLQGVDEPWNHAHVGIDLLGNASVSVDLRAMWLRVDNCTLAHESP